MTTYSVPELEPYMVLAQEVMRRVYAEESPDELNAWLLTQVQRLSGAGNEAARLLWEDSFALYEEIMAKRAADAALPEAERKILTWPWSSWNHLIDPLDAGMLAVLAAGDGSGKTLYCESIAEYWARKRMNVVFVHFELNRALMLDRRMVRHAGIPRRALKDGVLSDHENSLIQAANEHLRSWPGSITYLHTPGWTMERVVGEVGALVMEELCDVFVIDYLEKATASQRQHKTHGSNVFAREADDVELVKTFAERANVPALLLAQLNKGGKRGGFDELDRTSIRGAGEKTEKANVVILLHREDNESSVVHVRVDKNTMGACGSFTQYMEPARFMVADMAEEGQL